MSKIVEVLKYQRDAHQTKIQFVFRFINTAFIVVAIILMGYVG